MKSIIYNTICNYYKLEKYLIANKLVYTALLKNPELKSVLINFTMPIKKKIKDMAKMRIAV